MGWLLGTSKYAFSGPWSMWSEFSEEKQAMAIRHALTIRYVQGDLVVFENSLDLFEKVADQVLERKKENLLVVAGDLIVPKEFNFSECWINSLPVTGINVLSILKHEKLAIEAGAVRLIEERLMDWEKRYPFGNVHDFGDTERHVFYKDSKHVEAKIDHKTKAYSDVKHDKIEAEGPNMYFRNENKTAPFFDKKDVAYEDHLQGH